MTKLITQTLIEYWPVIVTAFGGVISAILTYIVAKTKAKTKCAELELANIELQKAMIEGAYVLCPDCGSKIMLKDTKIYFGGKNNEK